MLPHLDSSTVGQINSQINALKGLTYYHVLPENVDYALNLIQTKQRMRSIRKSLKEPLWVSIGILNSRLKHEMFRDDVNVLNSMVEYRDSANSLISDKYESVISEINKSLRDYGVGKF
jgi:hypothetical protein